MSDKITADIHGFEPGAIIELFELDLSAGIAPLTEPILRWHSGINENMQEVVWQGNRYSAMPIEAEGFEFSGMGSIPRPTVTVANITSILSSVINSYDDLVGAKITRKKTFAKYLDSYCYTSGYPTAGVCAGETGVCSIPEHTTLSACTTYGGVWSDPSLSKSDCLDCFKNGSGGTWTVYNKTTCEAASGPGIWYASAIADDTAHFPEEIWYVDRKAVETRTHIQFELTAAHDIHGVKLPSRTVVANSCPWVYKGVECGYSGSNYWDITNEPTPAANDICSKTFTACELRFPEPAESPFGGFPGAGINMGSIR
jgi:phage-related protein